MNLGAIGSTNVRMADFYQNSNNLVSRKESSISTENKTAQNVSSTRLANTRQILASDVFTTFNGVVTTSAQKALDNFVTLEDALTATPRHQLDWVL